MVATRVLVLGAAGRDFHDFATVLRDDPAIEVVGFTGAQIPGIDRRTFPAALAGPRYPQGIEIHPEAELEHLIATLRVDEVILAYSDLAHATVMHLASRALAAGASFRLVSPQRTMLRSTRPVIAVTAVRTGCGKSQVARYVTAALRRAGHTVGVCRHPMPYGDLEAQRVQRFATIAELDAAGVTIEEREDYEPHVLAGSVVHTGVDYAAVLRAAEAESSIVVWDGGNNDTPFFRPELWITIVDPFRVGHELGYHPGETNFRAADVIVILRAELADAGLAVPVTAVSTLVRVDPADPAFATPDKPVGPFYDADEAARLRERGWTIVAQRAGGFRRVVPSPHPIELVDATAIHALLDAGHVVLAGGGGGVPVSRTGYGALVGVEAVIDKDRTAALLGRVVGARELYDLTAIDYVYRSFGRDDAVALPALTAAEARRLATLGEFPAGSMGPKIDAALDFLATGDRVLITALPRLADALAGRCGTWITR